MKVVLGFCIAILPIAALHAAQKRDVGAIKIMQGFGTCVGQHRQSAIRFLATLPESQEETKLAGQISSADCLAGGELRFRARLLRGAVAEALLKTDRLSSHDKLRTFAVPISTADLPANQRTAIGLVVFGQCVAHSDSAGVAAVLASPSESKAEMVALGALRDAMGQCVASDVNFRMDRFQMRGYLAEGAYRNAVEAGEVVPHA